MQMIKSLAAGLVLAATLGQGAMAQDTTAQSVLAVVNGTEITLGHVIALRDELPDRYDSVPAADLFPALLTQLINQTALLPLVDTQSQRAVLMLENQRRAFLASTALEDAARAQVTEEAVRARYDTLPAQTEWKASHILVETQEEAAAIAQETRAGADFAETAKAKSTGPSGPNGGDLGWFGRGQMVPEFETAVSEMKPGDVSDPVQTQFGWHVVKLFETGDAPKPDFAAAAPEIAEMLEAEVTDALLESAAAAADIQRVEIDIDPAMMDRIDLITD